MNRLSSFKLRWPMPLNVSRAQLLRRLSAVVIPSQSEQSRLQRRLTVSLHRDRVFFNQIRQRRLQHENKLSRLSQRLQAKRPLRWSRYGVVAACLSLGLGSVVWSSLFVSDLVTLGGVPYSIVHTFWNDKLARDAYFSGDRETLHARLRLLGVEEDIKNYYRDRFENRFKSEHDLDRHIHQIMFDQTGYVGQAYNVDNYGRLNSRSY